jgi:hypothetical protein
MRPPGTSPLFNHLYVVYELMDTDLHQVIRSSQPLSPDHLAYILYQARQQRARVRVLGPHLSALFGYRSCEA